VASNSLVGAGGVADPGAGGVPGRVVVVGASAGGLAVAEGLRRLGYRGDLTIIGNEPHLPYDRPPLSKQVLTGELDLAGLLLRPAADIDALGADLRLGETAAAVDLQARIVTLAGGAQVGYDALVVATGVRPRRLPGTENLDGVHTLRTVEDALALKERFRPGHRLVVAGAGFIGAEAAAAARALGMQVTVVEPTPVPLARALGDQVGRALARAHRDHGVDLRTGIAVEELLASAGRVAGVRLTDGTVIPCRDLVVGIGSVPNTEWLAGSGLPLGDGLLCDQYSMAAPGVYGVGDVARWHNPLFGTAMRIEHRTNAAEQGLAVARAIADPAARRPFAPVPYFWSDQYDMKIQAYGYLHGHHEVAVIDGDLAARRFTAAYRTGDHLAGIVAVGAPPAKLRAWRTAIAARQTWAETVDSTCAQAG
jgi:NADPH-dependent 2,4-dienoyl-CoA reductase/sulfur reductase-like enzyme